MESELVPQEDAALVGARVEDPEVAGRSGRPHRG